MKQALKPFQSVRFNIGLFAALALASILGTLIPQTPEVPEKVQAFIAAHPTVGPWMDRADLFNIYFSWWFIGMLGLMAFDVIVCKLIFGKFPGLRTFKKVELAPHVPLAQPFKAEWDGASAPETAARYALDFLKGENYKADLRPMPEGAFLVTAARHRLQRFGSWVSHVSILLILLANFTGALWGFREVLNVPEGFTQKLKHRPWAVTCDKFTVDWYEGTSTPKTFASNLRLFVSGQLARESEILVNEPLEHKKVRFYQASYGPYLKEARLGLFMRRKPKSSPSAVTVRLDEDVPVPGTAYSLRILQFVPDFSMDENQKVVSRSVHPENPALQVLVSENGKPLKAPWVFLNYPALNMPPAQASDEFIVVLAEYVPSFYTGLQITYDPGADLFWTACAILVVGLMTLFYFNHRKVWVLVEPHGSGARWKVGGTSSRGKSFEADFLRLADELKLRSRGA